MPIGDLRVRDLRDRRGLLAARSSVPSIPQPASELASASEPARPRNRRRVLSHARPRTCAPGSTRAARRGRRRASPAPSRSVFCVNTLSSSPPAVWITYWIETPRNAATTILPAQDVASRPGTASPAGDERDLLRPHADADVAGHARALAGTCSVGAVVGLDALGRRSPSRRSGSRCRGSWPRTRSAGARRGRWPSPPARSCRRSSPRSCRPCSWPPPDRG